MYDLYFSTISLRRIENIWEYDFKQNKTGDKEGHSSLSFPQVLAQFGWDYEAVQFCN